MRKWVGNGAMVFYGSLLLVMGTGCGAEANETAGDQTMKSPESEAEALVPPFYEYNLPPDGGSDKGKIRLDLLKGALTDRSDSGVMWNNGENQLNGKVITVTFDLGRVEQMTQLRARAAVPPWFNFSKGTFMVSEEGQEWKTIGAKEGFPSHVGDGGPTRPWEFIPEMEPTPGRYVRYEVIPAGWVHPNISEITITIADKPEVATAKKTATSALHGFFRPDVLPPQEWDGYWGERWRNGDPAVPEAGGPGGFLQLYLHNDGNETLHVRSLRVSDGKDMQVDLPGAFVSDGNYSSPRLGRPENSPEVEKLLAVGDPVWFNVEPHPVPVGGRAELTIRCRVKPRELPTITINDSEKHTVSLKEEPEALRISSVSFSYDLRRVYVYGERSSENVAPVKAILWDGADRGENLLPQQRGWERDHVAGFILHFQEPLQRGDFHQITAITDDGRLDTVQVKVRDAFFPVCMFGPPYDEEVFLRDVARNHFNSIAWYDISPEKAIQFGLRTFSGAAHSAVYGAWVHDEPDCGDYGCDPLKDWLRLGALGMYCAERRREIHAVNPAALQMLNLNATFKPINWMCYAQLGDIIAHDPYYTCDLRVSKDPMYVYASMKVLTDNCRPKPSFPLLFACSWGPGDGLPPTDGFYTEFSRFATAEEIELQNAYALAAGVKGMGYWWYRNEPTVANNPPMLRAMGRVNVRLSQIVEYVAHGIPTNWATAEVPGEPKWHPIASEPVRVWCRTIWSPEAVVVLVCHNEYTSNKEGFHSEPIENVPVTVQLPELWENPVELYEITDAGTGEPTMLEIQDHRVRFTVPSVKVSNWYVLERR